MIPIETNLLRYGTLLQVNLGLKSESNCVLRNVGHKLKLAGVTV